MWSKDLETIIQKLGDDALIYEKLHESKANSLSTYHAVLLHCSTLFSGVSFFLGGYSYFTNDYLTSILGLCSATLTFISQGLLEKNKLHELIKRHEFASFEYKKISYSIIQEFVKDPKDREDGESFLRKIIDRMSELYKNSPIVEKKMILILRNISIKKPEAKEEKIEIQVR